VLPEIAQDERIGLDEGYQLFLLFEDLLEVLIVVFGVLLLFELFNDFYLGDLNQTLEVLPELVLSHKG
jgi:hypothetical protein